ncbi:hypothetical protein [Neptuniibacter sp.]|uniref:ATP-binding protein n=1 Tax=Neptuniibacter sp. TaxID=1962643 RepID=UPI002627A5B6|nr:hypothetical protein [Neptuniibacter sp.]MCP4598270.1 hypothetical protein [Neptuniibacter sp.]
MSFSSVRTLMGASIFCPTPSILAIFDLSTPAIRSFSHLDHLIEEAAKLQLKKIGITLSDFSGVDEKAVLPSSIELCCQIAVAVFKKLDLYTEHPVITWDEKRELVFIAFPEINRILSKSIIVNAINYVVDLYTQQKHKNSITPSEYAEALNNFISQPSQYCKTRVTNDIQRSLRQGSKPWIALDFTAQTRNAYQIGFGKQNKYLFSTFLFDSSGLGVSVASSKAKTQQYLSQLGFNTPEQSLIANKTHALKLANHLGFPVVIKADLGAGGTLVYSDLQSEEELSDALSALETKHNGQNIIEKFVPGNVYRIEVVNGDFFDCYEMIPAAVIGDGVHPITKLVDIENDKPARKSKSDISGMLIPLKLGPSEQKMLTKQDLTVNSIPEKGQLVKLSANSNWSTGGSFKNVTSDIHTENKRLVERISTTLKVEILGIDVITNDISKPFHEEELVVIEVNHAPEIHSYFDTEKNEFIDISKRIVEKIAPNVRFGDVPIITLKTSDISQQAAKLLVSILNKEGNCCGHINSQGMFINGQMWANSKQIDHQNPNLQLLRNNTVGSAVVEQSPEQLADYGVGSGACDIAIISDCNNTLITTPVWKNGVSTSTIDQCLIDAARSATIILVNNNSALELCLKNEPDKVFAIIDETEFGDKLIKQKELNYIKVLSSPQHNSVKLRVQFEQTQTELTLSLTHTTQYIPSLITLATLLSKGIGLEKAVNLVAENG